MAITGNETFLTQTTETNTLPNSSRLVMAAGSGLFLNSAGGVTTLDTSASFKSFSSLVTDGFLYRAEDGTYSSVTIESTDTIIVDPVGGGTMSLQTIPSSQVQLSYFQAEGFPVGTGNGINLIVGEGLNMLTDFSDGIATYILGADGQGSGTMTSVTATTPLLLNGNAGGTAQSGNATVALPAGMISLNTAIADATAGNFLIGKSAANTATRWPMGNGISMSSGVVGLTTGSNASTLNGLPMTGNAGKVVRVNAVGTELELGAPDAGGTVTSVTMGIANTQSQASPLRAMGTVTISGALEVGISLALGNVHTAVYGTTPGILSTTSEVDNVTLITPGSGLLLSGGDLTINGLSDAVMQAADPGFVLALNDDQTGFDLVANGSGTGTVTSVTIDTAGTAITTNVPLTVVGSPITTNGTIDLIINDALKGLSTLANGSTAGLLTSTATPNITALATIGGGLGFSGTTLSASAALQSVNNLMGNATQILATSSANTAVNLAVGGTLLRTNHTLDIHGLTSDDMISGNAGKVIKVKSDGSGFELGVPDAGGTVTSVAINTTPPTSSIDPITATGSVTTTGTLTVQASLGLKNLNDQVHGATQGLLGTTTSADVSNTVVVSDGVTLSGNTLKLTSTSNAHLLNNGVTLNDASNSRPVVVNADHTGFTTGANIPLGNSNYITISGASDTTITFGNIYITSGAYVHNFILPSTTIDEDIGKTCTILTAQANGGTSSLKIKTNASGTANYLYVASTDGSVGQTINNSTSIVNIGDAAGAFLAGSSITITCIVADTFMVTSYTGKLTIV